MLDTGRIIFDIEQRIGKEPRTIDWAHYGSIIDCQLPTWDWENDSIRPIFDNWRRVFEHGFVTMAHIVQANSLLFEFGEDNCPGATTVWYDQRSHPDLILMRNASRAMFDLKSAPHLGQDEWERNLGHHLADEHQSAFGWAVPQRFRGHYDVRFSSVYFDRRHIPGGKLIRSWFPCVALRDQPNVVAMVPRDFWPPELAAHWMRPRMR